MGLGTALKSLCCDEMKTRICATQWQKNTGTTWSAFFDGTCGCISVNEALNKPTPVLWRDIAVGQKAPISPVCANQGGLRAAFASSLIVTSKKNAVDPSAYKFMHIARRALATATGTGWSLRRLRKNLLRAVARLLISGHRKMTAQSAAAAWFWSVLWLRPMALGWTDT